MALRVAAFACALLAGCSGPSGTVTTVAGGTEPGLSEGLGVDARFNSPSGIVVAEDGTLYVADAINGAIRRVTTDGRVTTLVGGHGLGHVDGAQADVRLFVPVALALDGAGNLLVGDGGNHDIRRVSLTTGDTATLTGRDAGYVDGALDVAQFMAITALVFDASTGVLYVVDSPNNVVRAIDERAGTVSTIAGNGELGNADGRGVLARFDRPVSLARDPSGVLWVTDTNNGTIRRIDPDHTVTTVRARFTRPWGLVYDDEHETLLVAESWSHVVSAVAADGSVRLFAGVPSAATPIPMGADGLAASATFRLPGGLALGNGALYVSEQHRIRRVSP